jgi:hypothetical protein
MDLQYCTHEGQNSWWESDARGIPLCRVCDKCEDVKLAQYRRDVLGNPLYLADEPIEEE